MYKRKNKHTEHLEGFGVSAFVFFLTFLDSLGLSIFNMTFFFFFFFLLSAVIGSFGTGSVLLWVFMISETK